MRIEDKWLIITLPELPAAPRLYGLSFNIWDSKYALLGANGVEAATPTRFYIRVQ